MAFSVQKTETAVIAWSLTPIALAIISWGMSFYFGCKNLSSVQSVVLQNYGLLQLKTGTYDEQPSQEELLYALSGIRDALASNIGKAIFYAKWQFRLLIIGAIFFLSWHIVGIIVRTFAHV